MYQHQQIADALRLVVERMRDDCDASPEDPRLRAIKLIVLRRINALEQENIFRDRTSFG